MIDLRPTPFDHPDAVRLIGEVQQTYRELYGGEDTAPTDPAEFAPPAGYFVVGYLDGVAIGCGGWRAANGPALRAGDAEIKRMYVATAHRGRGFARLLLADLERSAATAGRARAVLETGTPQSAAIALYRSAGYTPIPTFGPYRDEPHSRCFAKALTSPAGKPRSRNEMA